MTALSAIAEERGIHFFLIAFTDLFGVLRAKLVPARAIDAMANDGAGFGGFATWFDMTPADPDVLAVPDPASLIQLPWKPEVGWMAATPTMAGKPVDQAPRNVLRRLIAQAEERGLEMRVGVEPERLGGLRHRQLVAPLGNQRPHRVHRAADDAPHVHGLLVQPNPAAGDARYFEQVIHQLVRRSKLVRRKIIVVKFLKRRE